MQAFHHDTVVTVNNANVIDANASDASAIDQHIDLNDTLIARIDEVLPQTHCQQCGYAGCKPYAAAIAHGSANINQCPPGGEAAIRALATLVKRPYLPLDTAHGISKPKAIAVIDEQRCIGCTLCIQACPVDAILGAAKQMHTVISLECTGCELCLAPCPVDCIVMQPPEIDYLQAGYEKAAASLGRVRYQNRQARLDREKQTREQPFAEHHQPQALAVDHAASESTAAHVNSDAIKKSAIAAAMARVKALKAAAPPSPAQHS